MDLNRRAFLGASLGILPWPRPSSVLHASTRNHAWNILKRHIEVLYASFLELNQALRAIALQGDNVLDLPSRAAARKAKANLKDVQKAFKQLEKFL